MTGAHDSMNTQDTPMDNGGNNGPFAHADTNSDSDDIDAMPADQPEPVTDTDVPNFYADRVAYPHVDADADAAFALAASQSHADPYAHIDADADEVPHPHEDPAADWRATVLPAERIDNIRHAFDHVRQSFDDFAEALLNAVAAFHHLARLLDDMPELRDGEPAGGDGGDDSGVDPDAAGWDWGAGRD